MYGEDGISFHIFAEGSQIWWTHLGSNMRLQSDMIVDIQVVQNEPITVPFQTFHTRFLPHSKDLPLSVSAEENR